MGGIEMAVLVKMTATGLDLATYDQMSSHLEPLMAKYPGFTMHVAYPVADGFIVEEIWASRAEFESWFNENVKPNLPHDIQPEVIELHAVAQP
jgi:heme-degrading monooxygenase HmoA